MPAASSRTILDALRHRVADLDGPVHYLDYGGEGSPALLIHGLGGSALNWMAVAPQMAESRRVLAIDLAGFGQTPLFNRSATVGANAKLVHAFIERVIGEPVLLVGNSMGGHISIIEAADHPDAVSGLVLVDAALAGTRMRRFEPVMVGALAAISVPGLGQVMFDRRIRRIDAEQLVQQTLDLVCADASRVDPEVVKAHVDLTRERTHLRQNTRAFVQAFRSIGLRVANPRFWLKVAQVKAPGLIIHGRLDRIVPLGAAIELKRRRPDWKLEIIEAAGHVPMLETPNLFMQALRGWSAFKMPSESAAVS